MRLFFWNFTKFKLSRNFLTMFREHIIISLFDDQCAQAELCNVCSRIYVSYNALCSTTLTNTLSYRESTKAHTRFSRVQSVDLSHIDRPDIYAFGEFISCNCSERYSIWSLTFFSYPFLSYQSPSDLEMILYFRHVASERKVNYNRNSFMTFCVRTNEFHNFIT